MSITEVPAWKKLAAHVPEVRKTHLRELLKDAARSKAMIAEHDGIILDFSRQNATSMTMNLLIELAKEANVPGKL